MAPQLPGTILVIDDEGSFVRALTRLLRRDGYHVDAARNGRHALTQLQARPHDVIFVTLQMPDVDGPAFYALLTQQYPALRQRVIFLTGTTQGVASWTFLAQCGCPGCASPVRSHVIRRAIQDVLQPPHLPRTGACWRGGSVALGLSHGCMVVAMLLSQSGHRRFVH